MPTSRLASSACWLVLIFGLALPVTIAGGTQQALQNADGIGVAALTGDTG